MINLIPHFIGKHFDRRDYSGKFQAASLFIDISGFTHLTETLMQHHKDGAEVLTDLLNQVFTPLVHEVYGRGGFITTFAGDAFTALFPLRRRAAIEQAAQTAFFIQDFFNRQGRIHSRYGDFSVAVKVGLGLGPVQWGIWGTPAGWTYFFRGPAIDSCTAAEHYAHAGEIVAADNLIEALSHPVCTDRQNGYSRLDQFMGGTNCRKPRLPALKREHLTAFGQSSVLDLLDAGTRAEFRQVAGLFMALESDSAPDFEAFVQAILESAARYGGYFNKLDFGDKGAVILILFGAPVTHENDLIRAADLLIQLRRLTTPVRWKAGLTFGTVYAGCIGGKERTEYTAIGDQVNLASRLMQAAPWNEIWMPADEAALLETVGYQCLSQGEKSFKGKSQALWVKSLLGKSDFSTETAFYKGPLIGRAAELQELSRWTRSLFAGQFGGMIYIYGEAGAGKSRLIYEFQQQLSGVQWFYCPVDQVLCQPLNPFRYFLRRYFLQSSDLSFSENQARFDRSLNSLIDDLKARGEPTLAAELHRTRSFLAALIDLNLPGSLYERLDPKLRYENTQMAFKTLVKAESLRQPLILYIEDAQGLDEDSRALLKFLTHHVERCPFAILLTSRYQRDGSGATIPIDSEIPEQALHLQGLAKESLSTLLVRLLDGPADDSLIQFVVEKSRGNPFFAEQLIVDLRERGAIKWQGTTWQLEDRQLLEVPQEINAILISHLDRLSAQVKAVVQTAAVLGQEFEVQILSQMLKSDETLPLKIQEARSAAVWLPLNELRYLFRHALLRDAAYDMQLRIRLRELHQLAAQSIEIIGRKNPAAYYADLTYHYGKAEVWERERYYAGLAGEQAAARFANLQAVGFFTRALELTAASDLTERCRLLLAREQVYERQGRRTDQAQDLTELEASALQLDLNLRAETALRRSLWALCTGDYSAAGLAAQTAIEWAQQAGDSVLEARGYHAWGATLRREGRNQEAQAAFERTRSLGEMMGDPLLVAQALHGLGYVNWQQGNLTGARDCFEQGVVFADEAGNLLEKSSALSGLALALYNQGNYVAARPYLEQALQLNREVGDRRGEMLCLINLGNMLTAAHEPEAGRSCLQAAMLLAREIEDRENEGIILYMYGDNSYLVGDFDRAIEEYRQSQQLLQPLKSRFQEANALRLLAQVFYAQGEYEAAYLSARQALEINREIASYGNIADSLEHLADALSGLGRLDEAAAAYREAQTMLRAQGAPEVDSWIGLAEIALRQDRLPEALKLVEQILAYLGPDAFSTPVARGESRHALDSWLEPLRIYAVCYRVLTVVGDSRAVQIRRTGYELLQTWAAMIADPEIRRSFLENVPWNRELAGGG